MARPRAPLAELLRQCADARTNELMIEYDLTPRECQVFQLLVRGHTTEEIGQELDMSERTARFHQSNILEKLKLQTRLDVYRLFFG
jgi:DNA-binding NarL/FixJ family response regulator